ncbi:A disintegrin and metalloproteinase with thrombospondin motifs 1 isoform X4 [Drosophila teissieri]|uniref:A disintegrin and metalloproteinase with thrombospondin motifs 1 isoform X4 n=1 Tax=Drosophila teissieri TaxID=7243 RepID=UPI001CB9DE62|nr:A disintegrin and metalloproteinase with thrombospondin motifs 1 isoform X4 [Drosophila teissieri]
MSSPLVLLTALLLASSTICQALPDLHKQMTPDQLQSVFHVDTHDAVPHYELVQLHHHENNHNRRRRSIGEGPKVNAALPPHHVKKDLSKNAYYSELKHEAMASGGNHLFAPEVSAIKSHNVSFSAFGQHLNLSLRATQGLFKGAPHQLRMWTVGSEPNATHGLDLQEIVHEQHNSNDVGEVFQDEKNMAAILMRRHMETGDLIMEGSIGHDLVIKPLPHELSPHPEESHHIIYKREASAAEDQLSDFAFMEPDDLLASEKLERLQRRQRRSRRSAPSSPDFEDLNDEDEGALDAEPQVAESRTRSRRQAPYIIYPEVLVIVDYDGYRLHGGDNLQVKRYFISFWNGVDLRYRLLKGPRIRISIAGIIISRGRDATPYLERNRVGRDAIDSAAALTDMGKYLFRERRLPVYDIAVAITKYDMCRRRKGGRCTKGTAGFAYVGGACVVNKRLEKVNSVAIIEDTGGFSGIIVAAHEVGHLLGAVHDGSPPPSYLGGPGAQRCRWEDGYIMSDLRHTERGFRWSACTVQSFHHFLNGDTATCLHNAPHEDSALGRSLPGTLLSLDAQCRRDRGTYACFKDERVCAQLFCFDAQTGYCVAYRPAAEGSACGNGYHCLDGRCTPLPSNIIPDYGNNYRLVYNKIDNKKDATEDIESSSEETESQEDETESVEDQDEGNTSSEEQEDNQVEQSSAAGVAAVQSTTTARTTTTTTVRTTSTAKPKSKSFGYLHRSLPERQWVQDNGVLVTTRISSSVSSSSSSTTNNADSAATSTRRPTTTTTQTPNLFQIYTHELRKQIEYYLHMLQTQQHATKLQPEQQQQQSQQQQSIVEIPLVQKRLTNYSVTSSSSSSSSTGAKQQAPSNKDENQRQQQAQQQLQDGLPDEENEATAGIQSNEAIERQKLVNWKLFPF